MKNTKEVGFTPDDNNDCYLPGSVQHEANRGDSAYGTNEYAKNTPLDAKCPMQGGCAKIGGDYVATPKKTADVTGAHGVVETTYDHANLSAKYKYPQVSQDTVPNSTI